MELGRYDTPPVLEDEDKIIIFTKKQLGLSSVFVVLGIGIIAFFGFFHMAVLGVPVGIFTIIVGIFCVCVSMPEDRYLFGAGYTIFALLCRVLRRKLKRVIYARFGYK